MLNRRIVVIAAMAFLFFAAGNLHAESKGLFVS